MFVAQLEAAQQYLHAGGSVMIPLVLIAGVLWFALTYRWMLLRHMPDDTVDEHALGRFGGTIHSLVMVAPLLGLLGTVGGMIETFDAMASMTLFSQSGGVAGGIAEALISTQMGLVVAVPALITGKMLRRREQKCVDHIRQRRLHASLHPTR